MTIKLTKEEIEQTTKDPLGRFRNSFRSENSLKKYERRLTILLCHTFEDLLVGNPEKRNKQKQERLKSGNKKLIEDVLDADFSERVNELVTRAKKDPEWAENLFMTFSKKLRERTQLPKNHLDYLNPISFSNYFKDPKKLFKMNNVRFNWDLINATFPELNTDENTRGYDVFEIQSLLKFANPLETAVILIAASSGIRRGGFDFTWECIIPIFRRNEQLIMASYNIDTDEIPVCGMIKVYQNSSEQYFAFFTPEAWDAIKVYRTQWIDDTGKLPSDWDPFMKQVSPFVKPLSPDAMANRITKLLKRSGLRMPLTNGKRRHEVPVFNGLRRFFNKINKETLSKDSPLGALIKKEFMMSHTGLIKLDKNYFKTHWQELVEEYLDAVPPLTISSDARLKSDNQRLRKEKSELEITRTEMEEMKREMRLIRKYGKISPKDDVN